jgi:hypothetical protein
MFQRLFRNGVSGQEEVLPDHGAAQPEEPAKISDEHDAGADEDRLGAGNVSSGVKAEVGPEDLPIQGPACTLPVATTTEATEPSGDATTAAEPVEKLCHAVTAPVSPAAREMVEHDQAESQSRCRSTAERPWQGRVGA